MAGLLLRRFPGAATRLAWRGGAHTPALARLLSLRPDKPAAAGKPAAPAPRAVEENVMKTKRRRAKVAREKGDGAGASSADDEEVMRCCAYAVPFEFDALGRFLRRSEHTVSVLPGVNDAIHVRLLPLVASGGTPAPGAPADAFVFDSGAIVLWGMHKEQEESFLATVRGFVRAEKRATPEARPLFARLFSSPAAASSQLHQIAKLVEEQTEQMDWVYRTDGSEHSDLGRDVIQVAPHTGCVEIEVLDRLAFSYALMQCVKLAHVEQQAETTLEAMRGLSMQLARSGNAKFISYQQLNRHIGQVMQLKEFNLDADIVETPDYFWEDSVREEMYQQLRKELEIGSRIATLNLKLTLTQEALQNVNSVVVNVHSTNLEASILYFVAFEASLSGLHIFGFLREGDVKAFFLEFFQRIGGLF
ncbi:hypothetical protein T492DRAFT_909378 [Pavlovales sp. CCMP2436]|nr:hypothetical protein T492DRAFT_909378 [Pavlovales sp. CCMP2436]